MSAPSPLSGRHRGSTTSSWPQSLRTILEARGNVRVAALGTKGAEAAALFNEHHPDIMLLDIRMPDLSGLAAGEAILARPTPKARIVFLTTFADDDYIVRALAIGARGYLIKQEARGLAEALHSVMEGQIVLGSDVTDRVSALIGQRPANGAGAAFDDSLSHPDNSQAAPAFAEGLTQRERDIAELIAEGLDNREIAQALYLSEGTVRNHISAILQKCGLRNRTQIAIAWWAVGRSVIRSPPPATFPGALIVRKTAWCAAAISCKKSTGKWLSSLLVMEMTHAPHIQQPRHPRHRETVRRALGGTIEFRHFTGFDQLFAPHAHGYPVIGLVREGHRIMECNRTRYRLGPGQLLALNAGAMPTDASKREPRRSSTTASPCSISTIAGPIVEDTEAIALMGDLAGLMQEPIIDEAHVEEELCLLIGLLAAHNEPETSDQTARDLATHSQSEGREHPSRPIRQPPTRPLRPWPPI